MERNPVRLLGNTLQSHAVELLPPRLVHDLACLLRPFDQLRILRRIFLHTLEEAFHRDRDVVDRPGAESTMAQRNLALEVHLLEGGETYPVEIGRASCRARVCEYV